MAEVKAVAWVERTEEGLTRMWSADLATWANRPANPEPLYDQRAVAELRAEVERLRKEQRMAKGEIVSLEGQLERDIEAHEHEQRQLADAIARAERAEAQVAELSEAARAFMAAKWCTPEYTEAGNRVLAAIDARLNTYADDAREGR